VSYTVALVRAFRKTPLGRQFRLYLIKRNGKTIGRRVVALEAKRARRVLSAADEAAIRTAREALTVIADQLYGRLVKKYAFLQRVDPAAWRSTVLILLARKRQEFKALRGLVVEQFVPDMPEMKALMGDCRKLAQKRKGWGPPRQVTGARTRVDGREIGDLLVISEHEDGRVWIMAIVESKSLSNTADLITMPGEPGQHLWDHVRFKTNGFTLPGPPGKAREWLPEKIEINHVAKGKKPAPGAFETKLIAVTPNDFTTSQLNKLSASGDDIVRWPWPLNEAELDRFLREASAVLRKAGG
jgi:hypothetical protein